MHVFETVFLASAKHIAIFRIRLGGGCLTSRIVIGPVDSRFRDDTEVGSDNRTLATPFWTVWDNKRTRKIGLWLNDNHIADTIFRNNTTISDLD